MKILIWFSYILNKIKQYNLHYYESDEIYYDLLDEINYDDWCD